MEPARMRCRGPEPVLAGARGEIGEDVAAQASRAPACMCLSAVQRPGGEQGYGCSRLMARWVRPLTDASMALMRGLTQLPDPRAR